MDMKQGNSVIIGRRWLDPVAQLYPIVFPPPFGRCHQGNEKSCSESIISLSHIKEHVLLGVSQTHWAYMCVRLIHSPASTYTCTPIHHAVRQLDSTDLN